MIYINLSNAERNQSHTCIVAYVFWIISKSSGQS